MPRTKKAVSPVEATLAPEGAPAPIRFHESRLIPTAELRPNDWNPNDMTEAEQRRLREEIQLEGFIDPLIVVPVLSETGTVLWYRILGGEHRFRAAVALGLASIPCTVLSDPCFQDEERQRALTAKLIFLKGRVDRTKMVRLVQGFAERYGSEKVRDLFAVTDKSAWDRMVWGIRENLRKAGVTEGALSEFDTKAKDARSAKDLSEIVEALMLTGKQTLPYGFIVFVLGNKKYTYLPTTTATQTALDALMDYCVTHKLNINALLEGALHEALKIAQEPMDLDGAGEMTRG